MFDLPNIWLFWLALGFFVASFAVRLMIVHRLDRLKMIGPNTINPTSLNPLNGFKEFGFLAGGFRRISDERLSRLVGLYWTASAAGGAALAVFLFLLARNQGMI